jgi:hypothetical protein
VEQEGEPDSGAVWAEALERYSAMSVPQRAAEVLATAAPSIIDAWDRANWTVGTPRRTTQEDLLAPLIAPEGKRVTAEQCRTRARLSACLAEAFHAIVLARLLVPREISGTYDTFVTYVNSADGLGALQRGDVAEVVARRLPD